MGKNDTSLPAAVASSALLPSTSYEAIQLRGGGEQKADT
jgi:hypothetical protein